MIVNKLLTIITCCTAFGADISLKQFFSEDFHVGVALNKDHFYETDLLNTDLIQQHFNSITPENSLKWEAIHPNRDEYAFEDADRFVSFGTERQMKMIGHTLIWHYQTPQWVFEDEDGNALDRDRLLERMRSHIHTVVTRYKGRIHGWDVVNEALNEDGSLRVTPWLKIIGEDYLIKAFEFAHDADPEAELYYNDFCLENGSKRKAAISLIKKLQEHHIPIAAVGIQGHYTLTWPSIEHIENTIVAFAELGIGINISELDIDVLPQAWDLRDASLSPAMHASLNPYKAGLPDAINIALAKRYAELFTLFLKHSSSIERVTFWGLTDRDSWLNNMPLKDRTNYPLLFDREGNPKSALHAISLLKQP